MVNDHDTLKQFGPTIKFLTPWSRSVSFDLISLHNLGTKKKNYLTKLFIYRQMNNIHVSIN